MLVDYNDPLLCESEVDTDRERAKRQVLLDYFEGRWRVFWNLLWLNSWFGAPENRPDDVTEAFGVDDMTVTLYDGPDEQEARRIHAKFLGMLRHEITWVIHAARKKEIICEYPGNKEEARFWRERGLGEDICIACGVPLTEANRGKGPIRCRSCYDLFWGAVKTRIQRKED